MVPAAHSRKPADLHGRRPSLGPIRSNSTWFVIKADHDIPQIERVIFRVDGYVVVEKLVAQDDLEEMDPRSDGTDKP